jgi:methionyl-tRNA formyltransferase
VIAAGDGLLRVQQLQPEGRRAMTVREFLAGHPLRVGERFAASS